MEQLGEAEYHRHLSTIHALDHVDRLIEVALEVGASGFELAKESSELARSVDEGLQWSLEWVEDPRRTSPVEALRHMHARVAEQRTRLRTELLVRLARGQVDPAAVEQQLDSLRWLDEIAHAAYRIADHLRGERVQEPAPSAPSAPTS